MLVLTTTLLLQSCARQVQGNSGNSSLATWPKFHLDPGWDHRLTDPELKQVSDLNDAIDCARDQKKCPKP